MHLIHVEDPENFQVPNGSPNGAGKINIEVYAHYPIGLNDPGDLLGGLNGVELPVKGCTVNLKVIDAYNHVWLDTRMTEAGHGRYVFNDVIRDSSGAPMFLPEGSYIIKAAVGTDCNRLSIGVGDSVQPGGETSATYALISGKYVAGKDSRMLGAALTPSVASEASSLKVVGARTKAFLPDFPEPSATEFPTTDVRGMFAVSDHGRTNPFEAIIGQRLPDGSKNQRRIFQPFPYTRVAWLETSQDFLVDVQPKEASLEPGKSTEATVLFIPNGIVREGLTCPLLVYDDAAIQGVQVEWEDRFAPRYLGVKAPDPTPVIMRIKAGPEAKPGNYKIKVGGGGKSGNSCEGLFRNDTFDLTILKPVKVSLNAAQVTASGSSPLNLPITVKAGSTTSTHTTPATIKPQQDSDITLQIAGEITVAGKTLRFVDWEFNHDPNQRINSNPLTERIFDDLVITARYLPKENVSLNVEATIGGGTAPLQIPVPIGYRWGSSGSPVFGAGGPPPGPPTGSGNGTGTTPFEITPPRGVYVSLEAPFYAKYEARFYRFTKWEVGNSATTQNKVVYDTTKGNATVFARYELTSPAFQGNLDVANCQTISGWAWDRNQPNIPVNVDINIDEKRVATITANQFRQDLLNAGIGNGYHGFSYPAPASLKDGKPHGVSVMFWGDVNLSNSPKSFTITPAPVITDEPDDVKVCVGAAARLAVVARGDGLRYEWWKGSQRLAASGAVLSFNSVTKADDGDYRVIVTDSCSRSVSSRIARLTVGGEIAITTQPVNLVRCPGQMVVFAVTATGGNLTYQWRKNGVDIPKATERVYSIPSVAPGDAGTYHVVVSNGCDLVESSRVTLTVSPPPAISPSSQLFRSPGGNGKFNVTGAGCFVTAVSNVPWITITSGISGTGNWTVDYAVATNFGPERAGTITVGGATHTVTQLPRDVVNDAGFVVQQVYPVTMKAGQRYTVMIRMRNLGTATWTTAAGYKLVSQSPPNNSTWGRSSVELPGGSAAPSAEVTFSFEITAPSTPGYHTFQWRMAQNGVGFGDSTAALQLWVNR